MPDMKRVSYLLGSDTVWIFILTSVLKKLAAAVSTAVNHPGYGGSKLLQNISKYIKPAGILS
jgi:hypothetical protein